MASHFQAKKRSAHGHAIVFFLIVSALAFRNGVLSQGCTEERECEEFAHFCQDDELGNVMSQFCPVTCNTCHLVTSQITTVAPTTNSPTASPSRLLSVPLCDGSFDGSIDIVVAVLATSTLPPSAAADIVDLLLKKLSQPTIHIGLVSNIVPVLDAYIHTLPIELEAAVGLDQASVQDLVSRIRTGFHTEQRLPDLVRAATRVLPHPEPAIRKCVLARSPVGNLFEVFDDGTEGSLHVDCTCIPELPNCHECVMNQNGIPSRCSKCRNYKVLDDVTGECVDASRCSRISGRGKFGLRCLSRVRPAQTTTMTVTRSATRCVGKSFEDTGESCICGSDCHTCQWTSSDQPGRCEKCKNYKALNRASGECVNVDMCSSVQGSGKFNLVCIDPISTTPVPIVDMCVGREVQRADSAIQENPPLPCWCGIDCYMCIFNVATSVVGSCSKCRNSKVLLDGQCVNASRCNTAITGMGRFGLECSPRRRNARQTQIDSENDEIYVKDTTVFADARRRRTHPTSHTLLRCQSGRLNPPYSGMCQCNAQCAICLVNNSTFHQESCLTCAHGRALDRVYHDCFRQELCTSTSGRGYFGIECTGTREGTCVNQKLLSTDGTVLPESCQCSPFCRVCNHGGSQITVGSCLQCDHGSYLRGGVCVPSVLCGANSSLLVPHGRGLRGRMCVPASANLRQSMLILITDHDKLESSILHEAITVANLTEGSDMHVFGVRNYSFDTTYVRISGSDSVEESLSAVSVAQIVDDTIQAELCPTPSPTSFPSRLPTTSAPSASPTKLPTTASPTLAPSHFCDREDDLNCSFVFLSLGESGFFALCDADVNVSEILCPFLCHCTLPPTTSPTSSPSYLPTLSPTDTPTAFPTISPTSAPSGSPTKYPTAHPTQAPTLQPTSSPSYSPTVLPSVSPTSAEPTISPTVSPTKNPSNLPTSSPSLSPSTSVPTAYPTISPSVSPTTSEPTKFPTESPTRSPSASPTSSSPTALPTLSPTGSPTPVEVFSCAPHPDNSSFLSIQLTVNSTSSICIDRTSVIGHIADICTARDPEFLSFIASPVLGGPYGGLATGTCGGGNMGFLDGNCGQGEDMQFASRLSLLMYRFERTYLSSYTEDRLICRAGDAVAVNPAAECSETAALLNLIYAAAATGTQPFFSCGYQTKQCHGVDDPEECLPFFQSDCSVSSVNATCPGLCDSTEYNGCPDTPSPTTSPSTSIPSANPTMVPTIVPTDSPSPIPNCHGVLDTDDICKRYPAEECGSAISFDACPALCQRCPPTAAPTSSAPSSSPTISPTTSSPTESPSASPTTSIPSASPSLAPTTAQPTVSPTLAPTTSLPSFAPSLFPSEFPTISPTTSEPTASPSLSPSTSTPTGSPTASPTTASPTVTPTSSPSTSTPSSSPTESPSSAVPTDSPTVSPTSNNPTISPTDSPSSALPTSSPTDSPTSSSPTSYPTLSPTLSPSSSIPTATPSISPTTSVPTTAPTLLPTSSKPTTFPTQSPSRSPTFSPTSSPTQSPTTYPTIDCSDDPVDPCGNQSLLDRVDAGEGHSLCASTLSVCKLLCNRLDDPFYCNTSAPTKAPSNSPTTSSPTLNPSTSSPTLNPTTSLPTVSPTASPSSSIPTVSPTLSPATSEPTASPSLSPSTSTPTGSPTASPTTASPTVTPTSSPSTSTPSSSPTESPSSAVPTDSPTVSPTSNNPTISPTDSPSSALPTSSPTDSPTSSSPTSYPTLSPTLSPSSSIPTATPSISPAFSPTLTPTHSPTVSPSTSPSKSVSPTFAPTGAPTGTCNTRSGHLGVNILRRDSVIGQADTSYNDERGEMLGRTVAISDNGEVIAIGSADLVKPQSELNRNTSTGYTRIITVYDYNATSGSIGNQRGNAIRVSGATLHIGQSLSLANDGKYMAVGDFGGFVRVYHYAKQNQVFDWFLGVEINHTQISNYDSNIDSTQVLFGISVALSASGSTLVVGAPGTNDISVSRGFFQVYTLTWTSSTNVDAPHTAVAVPGHRQSGSNAHDHLGISVGVASDGSFVAAGACAGFCPYPLNLHSGGRAYSRPSVLIVNNGKNNSILINSTSTGGFSLAVGHAGSLFAVVIGSPNYGPTCSTVMHLIRSDATTVEVGGSRTLKNFCTDAYSYPNATYSWEEPPLSGTDAADSDIHSAFYNMPTSVSVSRSSNACDLFIAVGVHGPDPVDECAAGSTSWCDSSNPINHTGARVEVLQIYLPREDTSDLTNGWTLAGNAQTLSAPATLSDQFFGGISYPMYYGATVAVAVSGARVSVVIGAAGYTNFTGDYHNDLQTVPYTSQHQLSEHQLPASPNGLVDVATFAL